MKRSLAILWVFLAPLVGQCGCHVASPDRQLEPSGNLRNVEVDSYRGYYPHMPRVGYDERYGG